MGQNWGIIGTILSDNFSIAFDGWEKFPVGLERTIMGPQRSECIEMTKIGAKAMAARPA